MQLTDLLALPERRLQHLVRLLLADAGSIRQTTTGKPLQIISPGEWNTGGGPDFRNMAILVDGVVTIGDGEFHRRSAEWTEHGHHRDPAYSQLLLHIVIDDDAGGAFAEHTLVLDAGELAGLLRAVPDAVAGAGDVLSEELQEYAYRRLLRKTAGALDLCRTGDAVQAFTLLARQFLERRAAGKQRPGAVRSTATVTDAALAASPPALLLRSVAAGEAGLSLYRTCAGLVRQRWIAVGTAMRIELLVNAFLPVALAVAHDTARSELLTWFWSQRAAQSYGALKRKYPAVGQEYVWKQQGLLEYAALQKFGPDRVAETTRFREEHLEEAGRRLVLHKARIRLTVQG